MIREATANYLRYFVPLNCPRNHFNEPTVLASELVVSNGNDLAADIGTKALAVAIVQGPSKPGPELNLHQ